MPKFCIAGLSRVHESKFKMPNHRPAAGANGKIELTGFRHRDARRRSVPKLGRSEGWRSRRDSNPRYAFGAYNGLANRRLQPLGHSSAKRTGVSTCRLKVNSALASPRTNQIAKPDRVKLDRSESVD